MVESVSPDPRAEALKALPIFAKLPPRDVTAISRTGAWARYDPGQAIILQGDECNSMLMVVSGFVSLSFASEDGREVVTAEAVRGEILGGAELILGRRHLTNALAVAPTQVFSLRRSAFVDLLRDQAMLCTVLEEICLRWCRLARFAEAISLRSLEQRLASLLLDLCRTHGRPTHGGTLIDHPISQTEMARLINASRPKVNVHLHVWKDRALIGLNRRRIVVKDAKALENIAMAPPER